MTARLSGFFRVGLDNARLWLPFFQFPDDNQAYVPLSRTGNVIESFAEVDLSAYLTTYVRVDEKFTVGDRFPMGFGDVTNFFSGMPAEIADRVIDQRLECDYTELGTFLEFAERMSEGESLRQENGPCRYGEHNWALIKGALHSADMADPNAPVQTDDVLATLWRYPKDEDWWLINYYNVAKDAEIDQAIKLRVAAAWLRQFPYSSRVVHVLEAASWSIRDENIPAVIVRSFQHHMATRKIHLTYTQCVQELCALGRESEVRGRNVFPGSRRIERASISAESVPTTGGRAYNRKEEVELRAMGEGVIKRRESFEPRFFSDADSVVSALEELRASRGQQEAVGREEKVFGALSSIGLLGASGKFFIKRAVKAVRDGGDCSGRGGILEELFEVWFANEITRMLFKRHSISWETIRALGNMIFQERWNEKIEDVVGGLTGERRMGEDERLKVRRLVRAIQQLAG